MFTVEILLKNIIVLCECINQVNVEEKTKLFNIIYKSIDRFGYFVLVDIYIYIYIHELTSTMLT